MTLSMLASHASAANPRKGLLGMKARRTGLTAIAAALTLAALVVVIGAAQAAPSTKLYDASVRVTGGQVVLAEEGHSAVSATLKLTLTNRGKQTLGSANFTPPDGVEPTVDVALTSRHPGWTARFEDGTVKFRSASSAVALKTNEEVSADFPVTVSGCATALWTTAAKQSNDFSGQPGNEVQAGALDLTPLGSFSIDTIETVTADGQHVPAILTDEPKPTTTTAYDLCGNVKATYSGATRTDTLLTGASFDPTTGLDWSDGNGIGKVSITPAVTETDNNLIVTDPTTGVTDTSNFFDTTDRLCTSSATDPEPCEWSSQGGRITVNADHPPEDASLGIGFNSDLSFDCNNDTTAVDDTLVNINPRYEETTVEAIAVTLTYAKQATPGPANDYDVCFRKDDVATWSVLEQCDSTSPAPGEANCFISRKKVTGGDLEVVLWVKTDDPWTGLG